MAPQREWFEKDYYAVLGIPSSSTDVAATWRRFGWVPTTQAERETRIREQLNTAGQSVADARKVAK